MVTLTAVPSEGYNFEKWTGDVDGVMDTENSTIAIVMSKARIMTVNFTAPGGLSTVTVEAAPNAGGFVAIDTPCGSVTSDNTQPSIYLQCATGTEVTVTATAAKGFRFRKWEGDLHGSHDDVTLTVDSSKSITATFAKPSPFPWRWMAVGIVAFLLAAFAFAKMTLPRGAHEPKDNRRKAKTSKSGRPS